MRSFIAPFLVALVGVTEASPFEKRQSGSIGSMLNPGYGVVSPGANPIPRKVVETSRTPQIPGSKTVKVRYGPYKVPNATKKNRAGEMGTLSKYPHLNVEKPCTGDCVLLGISAGLEYLDGKEADTANGMWLHHMVAFTLGNKRMDPTCVGKFSMPHLLMNASPSNSERFFSVGNEKSVARFNPPWVKNSTLGYHLYDNDKFSFIVDLMNQNQEDKTVYMYLTYDYIEGHPQGIGSVKAIWLDVAQCGTSEILPPVQKGQFVSKYSWTANIEGEIMGAGGHVHDGGTHLTLEVDGKLICDSKATYGAAGGESGSMPGGMAGGMTGGAPAAAGGMPGGASHSHGGSTGANGKEEHITNMSACYDDALGMKELKKGQKWDLKAYYDYDKHPGMLSSNGKQSNVMGISVIYIKNPKT